VSGEAEQLAWIEKWARRIEAMGLSSMALLLIETARPFGLLGGQALLMTQPLLTGIVDETTVKRTTALMDSPDLLDRLRACLGEDEA
jgi:hypothetical protein